MLPLGQIAPQSRFNLRHDVVRDNLNNLSIHQHQKEALQALHVHFGNANNPNIALVVLPTGAGKSGIAVLAPYVLNKSKVLVITPSVVITKQLHTDFNGTPSFYERRHLITEANRPDFLERSKQILKTKDLQDLGLENLVIANAHKFGATANVNLDDIPNNFDLVIVDEAHHYPADTWRRIVDHFEGSSRLFLTATPLHNGGPILENQQQHLCFSKTRQEMVVAGIIRDLEFLEVGDEEDDDEEKTEIVCHAIIEALDQHDATDGSVAHQAMILTRTKSEANSWARALGVQVAGTYHGETDATQRNQFDAGQLRVLVVCGKLLEGYDNSRISVVGICRNVQPKSRVLFSQFVGRCVRKSQPQDPITARVISHVSYNQQPNFDAMDNLATEDPEDDI